MNRNNLNKSTLSKACNIPYTTIDGWYKKGYAGLKLTTLRKLAEFFGTSLDFWVSDKTLDDVNMAEEIKQLIRHYSLLSSQDRKLINNMIHSLIEKVGVDTKKDRI